MAQTLKILLEPDGNDPVFDSLRSVHSKLDTILSKFNTLEIQMATNQEVIDQALAGDTSALTALGERVADFQTKLDTTIVGLEATIHKLESEAVDVSALVKHLEELKATAEAVDPKPVEVPSTPPAEPPVETPVTPPAEETKPVEETPPAPPVEAPTVPPVETAPETPPTIPATPTEEPPTPTPPFPPETAPTTPVETAPATPVESPAESPSNPTSPGEVVPVEAPHEVPPAV